MTINKFGVNKVFILNRVILNLKFEKVLDKSILFLIKKGHLFLIFQNYQHLLQGFYFV